MGLSPGGGGASDLRWSPHTPARPPGLRSGLASWGFRLGLGFWLGLGLASLGFIGFAALLGLIWLGLAWLGQFYHRFI